VMTGPDRQGKRAKVGGTGGDLPERFIREKAAAGGGASERHVYTKSKQMPICQGQKTKLQLQGDRHLRGAKRKKKGPAKNTPREKSITSTSPPGTRNVWGQGTINIVSSETEQL